MKFWEKILKTLRDQNITPSYPPSLASPPSSSPTPNQDSTTATPVNSDSSASTATQGESADKQNKLTKQDTKEVVYEGIVAIINNYRNSPYV